MNLQLIRNNFYKITSMVAILTLVVMQIHTQVKAQDGSQSEQKVDTGQKAETTTANNNASEDEITPMSPNLPNIPNADCVENLTIWDSWSDTYNPNAQYNTSFMRGVNSHSGTFFQDINGDNLPDYIFYYHSATTTDPIRTHTTSGCTYLNNGNGWDLVFSCMAETSTNLVTGQITSQRYKGTCAGQPEANAIK